MTLLLTALGLLACAGTARAEQTASVGAAPSVTIVANGYVHDNPTYPYIGHGYEYDEVPGDNDMPWLRQYADEHGIFGHIDMSLDWKEREFEMTEAINYYTSHTMTWTGYNTVETSQPAKSILTLVDEHPEYV